MPRPPWIKKTNDRPKWVKNNNPAKQQERTPFYHTNQWRKVRNQYIKRHPICEKCEKIGITVEAKVVDHIIPMKHGGSRLSEENFMSLCNQCHNIKRQREGQGKIPKAKKNHNGELIPVDRWAQV